MRVKFCEIQILNGILSHVVPPFLGSLTKTENRNLHKLILVSGTQGKGGKQKILRRKGNKLKLPPLGRITPRLKQLSKCVC